MKTLIVAPCTLPVPAVHGGAVQQLIDSIIKENEKNPKTDLVVAGLWDEEAANESRKYSKTEFIYWKEPLICRCIDNLTEWIYTRVLRKNHRTLNLYARKIYVISRIGRELKKNDYDNVVLENMGYLLKVLNNRAVDKKYKGKIWFHLHNDIPNSIDIENLKKVKVMMISKYLEKKVFTMCGSEAPKMHVVKNGIDAEKFMVDQKTTSSELRSRFGISNDRKIVLFVGRMIPEKGVEQVIDAFLRIKDEVNAVLLIVGSLNFDLERKSDFIDTIYQKSNLADGRIIFTGFISQDEIAAVYNISDVAVLPSMWEEPAGLTMLEAAAAGVPVITTNSGGIPEYLRNDLGVFLDRDDYLVDKIGQNILDIIREDKKHSCKTKEAREYVRNNFSETNLYNSFIDTIQEEN